MTTHTLKKLMDITANEVSQVVPTAFLEANVSARNKLTAGLKREHEKQEALRTEFGSDAENLFQEWRLEQEAQQRAAETKLQECQEQEQETTGTKIDSKQES